MNIKNMVVDFRYLLQPSMQELSLNSQQVDMVFCDFFQHNHHPSGE